METIKENKLNKEKLDILAEEIKKAGLFAVENQKKVHRDFKSDGSVLTETDLEISKRIISLITSLFPECQIISEEHKTPLKKEAPFTFVLDPIDGTDVYSQGLPSFAVSLGILDSKRTPVGAIISAPRFGLATENLFIRLDPDGPLYINEEEKEFPNLNSKSQIQQICVSSKTPEKFNFSSYKGKIRIFGSSIIHLLLPAITDNFQATIAEPCFVWDITSSHALLKRAGMKIEYYNGEEFIYTDDFVYNKKSFSSSIVAGSEEGIKNLKEKIKKF